MKLDTSFSKQLLKVGELIKRYRFMLFILLFSGVYVFLLLSINRLTASEPDQSALDSELQTVKRLKVDEEAVEQLKRLREQYIIIESNLNDDRNNPFSE